MRPRWNASGEATDVNTIEHDATSAAGKSDTTTAPLSRVPNIRTLERGLATIFRDSGATTGTVTVLCREPNLYESTYASEIVSCRVGDGSERVILCKYAALYDGHHRHGHRGGTAYEAAVYRDLLRPSGLSHPFFYGAYLDESSGRLWLVLRYVERGVRLDLASEPDALPVAARWIGRFHAANERVVVHGAPPFLTRYDVGYYSGWARRTAVFAGQMHARLPWLALLCERYVEAIPHLMIAPQTVIHGEYYPHNVLYRAGTVFPHDWESAAVGAGEIDLASLIEGWDEETIRWCMAEYRHARWPDEPPATFERTFAVARLYWCFRWLGDHPDDTLGRRSYYFELLRTAGERLGLI